MTTLELGITVAACTLATILTRFLPFWLFPEGRETPAYIRYLGRVLPYAVMAMLVVYCLKGITPLSYPYGLPELIGVLATAGLHLYKRCTLLSIAGGTAAYMLMVQCIFV